MAVYVVTSDGSCCCGGDPIDTQCCPDNPIPRTLTMTVVGGLNPGSYTLTYNEGLGEWIYEGSGVTIRMTCSQFGISWFFVITVDFDTISPDLITCDPLYLEGFGTSSTYFGTADVFITV